MFQSAADEMRIEAGADVGGEDVPVGGGRDAVGVGGRAGAGESGCHGDAQRRADLREAVAGHVDCDDLHPVGSGGYGNVGVEAVVSHDSQRLVHVGPRQGGSQNEAGEAAAVLVREGRVGVEIDLDGGGLRRDVGVEGPARDVDGERLAVAFVEGPLRLASAARGRGGEDERRERRHCGGGETVERLARGSCIHAASLCWLVEKSTSFLGACHAERRAEAARRGAARERVAGEA